MKISVTTESDIYPLEVADDLELENFKALCEVEVSLIYIFCTFIKFYNIFHS